MVGVGRTVTGAVPSLSCLASPVPQCCYNLRDGGAVTEVSGWDPGHILCTASGWAAGPFVPTLERGGGVLRDRESRREL